LDQTYTTYWENNMSLLFFCFLFISAISYLLQKILTIIYLATLVNTTYIYKLHIVCNFTCARSH
jgi:predicted HAD superfamily hydrolase